MKRNGAVASIRACNCEDHDPNNEWIRVSQSADVSSCSQSTTVSCLIDRYCIFYIYVVTKQF